MENDKYLKELHNIVKMMNWKISILYKKLEKEFSNKEDIEFPTEDTFRKQYSIKGKGNTDNFSIYCKYISSLEEVKEKQLNKKTHNTFIDKLIITLGFILLLSAIPAMFLMLEYDPNHTWEIRQDVTFQKCVKTYNRVNCFKKNKLYKKEETIIKRFHFIRYLISEDVKYISPHNKNKYSLTPISKRHLVKL